MEPLNGWNSGVFGTTPYPWVKGRIASSPIVPSENINMQKITRDQQASQAYKQDVNRRVKRQQAFNGNNARDGNVDSSSYYIMGFGFIAIFLWVALVRNRR